MIWYRLWYMVYAWLMHDMVQVLVMVDVHGMV
jgi:hypothetical protein